MAPFQWKKWNPETMQKNEIISKKIRQQNTTVKAQENLEEQEWFQKEVGDMRRVIPNRKEQNKWIEL
jgi:virulence-associated protein VapD